MEAKIKASPVCENEVSETNIACIIILYFYVAVLYSILMFLYLHKLLKCETKLFN